MIFASNEVYKDKIIPNSTFLWLWKFRKGLFVWFSILALVTLTYLMMRKADHYSDGIHIIRWNDSIPELKSIVSELERCGAALRMAFPDLKMEGLFPCDEAGP